MVLRSGKRKTTRKNKKTEITRAKTLSHLTREVSLLKKRTRGSSYRFQMRQEHTVLLPVTGIPFVISLSDFNVMRPIFQARMDDGTINQHIRLVNKVRAGISGINYSINIDSATAYMFTVTIFIVKLKRTAKLMIDSGIAGVFNGVDMVTEKDYTITPGPLTNNRAQLVMLNKNIFDIIYHKRHVLGAKIRASPPAGGTTLTFVTNRSDTNIDKYFKLRHDKIYKAAYGNGWLENAGAELIQPIAGRPYMIIFVSKIDGTGLAGAPTLSFQQVVTLKTID